MAIYERMTIKGRGGALPTYQRQTGAYAPGAGVSARMDDSAARIASAGDDLEARALIRLGDTMNTAVQVGVKAYDDYSKSKATQLITQYRRDMNMALYGENGILTQKGEAALDADEQRAEAARKLRDSLMTDANEYTKRYFNILADDYDADTSLKAQQYAQTEFTTMQKRNFEAAAEEWAESAIVSYANERDFDKNTGGALHFAQKRLELEGYSGEALQRGLKETSSKIFRGAIENALAGNDVASARRLLERGSRMHGEGDGAWSRMTADDVAWGKNAIRTKQEALQAKAEAAAKKREEAAEKAFVESTSKEIMTQLDSFPKDWKTEDKEEKLVQLTADIEDPKRRKAVRALVKAGLDEKELVRKAGVVEELRLLDRIFEQNPNMTPTEKLSMIRTGTFSDETKEKAEKEIMDQLEGKENTYASAMGARAIRAKIDASGGTMDKKQIGVLALDYGLNSKDRNEVLEYQGKGQEYSQQRIDSLINSVLGKDTKEEQRIALYSALMRDADILSGAKLDDKQLKSKIRSLALEGQQSGETGWFSGGMTLAESVNSGNGKIWRPDIPEGMEKALSAELETRYPEYRSMTKEGKKIMRQAWYMNKYLGYPVEFTEEEKEVLGGGK